MSDDHGRCSVVDAVDRHPPQDDPLLRVDVFDGFISKQFPFDQVACPERPVLVLTS